MEQQTPPVSVSLHTAPCCVLGQEGSLDSTLKEASSRADLGITSSSVLRRIVFHPISETSGQKVAIDFCAKQRLVLQKRLGKEAH